MGWPNNPVDVHVDVILNPNNAPLPENPPDGYALPYRLESDDLEIGEDNFIRFRNNGHPGFFIHYHLRDPHKTGYLFPDDELEAMWSEKAPPSGPIPCPTTKSHWPQFKVHEVKPGKKILVVRNLNQKGHEARFGYTLRVTRNPHIEPTTFAHLDPPGDNTNGDNDLLGRLKTATADTLLVAAAAATAIFFGIGSLRHDLVQGMPAGALLIALTVGFGVAALLFRLARGR